MDGNQRRDEIQEEYKWDLTQIYATEEDCLKELEECKQIVDEIESFRGRITRSSKDLLEYVTWSDNIERKMYRVYFYVHLHFDEDTTNSHYQELQGKVDQLFQEYSTKSSFVQDEMMKTDYSIIQEYMAEEEELKTYQHVLENLYRYQKHTLSEEQQKIVAAYSNVLSASEDIFEALSDSDLEFGTIKDEEGKDIELNESNYSIYIQSKDREVRKNAFQKLLGGYASHKNTLAKVFSTNVEELVQSAKLHNFPSSIEASLYQDNISKEVYDNVIEAVHDHMDVAYKYFALKKEILGLEELHNYDLYCDLIPEYDKKYSFQEAKDLVFKAVEPLGEDYKKHLQRAFDEKWIDVYHNKGKRTGAYSSGFYDTNPYVLLNYTGQLDDVSTLAHELGHSMHSLYSWENNDYPNSNYQIFVAEVASTVNELLLSKYLLKSSTDEKEKLAVLNNLMELFKGTIIRQAMFAEFERDMHKAKEEQEVLTHEFIEDKYYQLNQLYFGEAVNLDDEIKYEWSRIPHFYYNFYVYKYVVGLSCACYIVENILGGKENAKEDYIKFLSSGGSMYPQEELLLAGIDITKKEVISSALEMFDETIDDFKKIYQKTR